MTKDAAFKHVILTRFNCSNSRSPTDREIAIRSQRGWLDARFGLFERYCLPSVLAQTNPNFEWHIYFDRQTAPQYLDRARKDVGGQSNIRIKLCDLYGSETVQEDLGRELPASTEWLLTTRLDNDDALHRDFVDRLHREVRRGTKEALNFPLGVVFGNGKTYLSRQASNAFISLSEPFPNPKTAVWGTHNTVNLIAPVRNIDGGPAWMQVVHNSNVSNKLRGRRMSRDTLLQGFDHIDFGSTPPIKDSLLAVASENATIGMARKLRDRLAGFVRSCRKAARTIF